MRTGWNRALTALGLAMLAVAPAAGQCLTATQVARVNPIGGEALDVFGSAVAISGDTAVVGAFGDDNGAWSNRGSAYVFTRTGGVWSLQGWLEAFDGNEDDEFGWTVAIAGDTIVVGARKDDTGAGADAGSAYVFTRSGMAWSRQAKLTASDGASGDRFGTSVAIAADTIVVGAEGDDNAGGAGAGAAYVFTRSGTAWTQQAKLTASDGATGDTLGWSIAIAGDTAVVGARYDDTPAGTDAGSAYVFARSGTVWSQQAKLTASDGAPSDWLGTSVAIVGDTIVAGASQDDTPGGFNAGSAYVFTRAGTVWTQQAKLMASDGAPEDNMGVSVGIAGDTAVVGAYWDDTPGGVNAGSTYVFVRSGTVWTQQAKLMASDGAAGDQLGRGAAIDGDTLLVGAQGDDTPGAANAGSAYVLTRSGTVWSQQAHLLAVDERGDVFGMSLAMSSDTLVVGAWPDAPTYVLTRSGTEWVQQAELVGANAGSYRTGVAISGTTVIVGAEDDAPAGTESGSAYVFTRSGAVWTQQAKLTASDGAVGALFGSSVAISGDTAAVGASGADTPAGSNAGAVYVFTRSGTVWTQQAKLLAPDGAPDDEFGFAVAMAGDTIVVGVPADDTPAGTNAGSVYVFARAGTVWSLQAKLTASDGGSSDDFGFSVAIDANTLVVGAKGGESPVAPFPGCAYVFARSGATWAQQAKLFASDGDSLALFGCAVAITGDYIAVGARWADTPAGFGAGSAYLFQRSGSVWTQQAKLLASDGAEYDDFGWSVAITSGTVVVGAPDDDAPWPFTQGSASIFSIAPGPPPMPSTVKASEISPGVVKVTWKDLAPCETAFEFLREMRVGATWTSAVVAGSSPALSGINKKGAWQQSPGPGAWRYSARAINAAGASSWSTPAVVKPAAPSGLAAVWVAGGAGHNVKLTWVDNSGFESGSKFKREMQSGSSWINSTTVGNGQIGANATMFTDPTIPTPGVYRYRLQAFNSATNSAWTPWVQITVP